MKTCFGDKTLESHLVRNITVAYVTHLNKAKILSKDSHALFFVVPRVVDTNERKKEETNESGRQIFAFAKKMISSMIFMSTTSGLYF